MSLSLCKTLPVLLFPSLAWWSDAWRIGDELVYSSATTTRKQPEANRYTIITANGVQRLSVPLLGGRRQQAPLSEIRIDYKHDWQRQHWGALYSAYGRAPYFEHYGKQLESIIYNNYERLLDINMASISWILQALRAGIPKPDVMTNEPCDWIEDHSGQPPYYQVFRERWGFVGGLSIIDLLMNEGPHAAQYLAQYQKG